MSKQKYYYVIVEKGTSQMALIQGELPIYWSKIPAQYRCNDFTKYEVKRINANKLQEILNEAIKPKRSEVNQC